MTLDPRWSIILSLILALGGFLTGSAALLADTGLDPLTIKHFLAWDALATGAGNVVLAVLTGIPSKDNQTGFIVKGPPKP